jgi:ABC-type sugar transport system permease subunit
VDAADVPHPACRPRRRTGGPDQGSDLLGANPWQLHTIVLPKMKTIIIIALAIRVIENFKIFDTLYIMTGGGLASPPKRSRSTSTRSPRRT